MASPPSAIYDLQATVDFVNMYSNFRDLQNKAAAITAQQGQLAALLTANPLFAQNVSAAQQAFFSTAVSNSSTFSKNAPVDPDATPSVVPPSNQVVTPPQGN